MTKEKELGIFIAEMVNGLPDSGDNFKDCFTLAKALTQRYPQILAEKVWEGNPEQLELDSEKGISVIGEIPLAWNHLEIYAKGGVKSE